MQQELNVDWPLVRAGVDTLAYQLEPLKPLAIVGIQRGGLIPAVMLSHKLDIPMYTLRAKSYLQRVQGPLEIDFHGLYASLALNGMTSIDEQRLLFVDDILDTGATYDTIRKEFQQAPFASLVTKRTLLKTHYFCFVPEGVWVNFPWE